MVEEMSTENSTHDRKLATSFVVFQTVVNGVRPGRRQSHFPLPLAVPVPFAQSPGLFPPLGRPTSDIRRRR